MPQLSVIIVDDHPLFSKGLAQLVESQSLYCVAGEATDSAAALSLVEEKRPSLAIVDLDLGDEDGLELIKNMKALSPELTVLVLSMHEERYYAERALRAGAKGYIMKEEAASKVLDAIKTVMSGKTWLSERERERIFGMMSSSPRDGGSPLASISSLSDRQLQIFKYIGKGLGTVEIAARLNLSSKTIDTHKEHIKEKLRCGTTQELRQLAIEWVKG